MVNDKNETVECIGVQVDDWRSYAR
jgi:hypothetical protein